MNTRRGFLASLAALVAAPLAIAAGKKARAVEPTGNLPCATGGIVPNATMNFGADIADFNAIRVYRVQWTDSETGEPQSFAINPGSADALLPRNQTRVDPVVGAHQSSPHSRRRHGRRPSGGK